MTWNDASKSLIKSIKTLIIEQGGMMLRCGIPLKKEKIAYYLKDIGYITSMTIQDNHNKSSAQNISKEKIETRIIVFKIKNMGQSIKPSL